MIFDFSGIDEHTNNPSLSNAIILPPHLLIPLISFDIPGKTPASSFSPIRIVVDFVSLELTASDSGEELEVEFNFR